MIKKFSIPDYYGKCNFIIQLLQYRQQFPQYFYQDRIIDNCYGAHPDILWTGGRKQITDNVPTTPMSSILNQFSLFPQVELRHVCTNYFITPELTTDYRTNFFLSHYLRSRDKIIVANDILIQYLKEKYPKTELVYSTTMNITDIHEVNKITENNIYVLNYNYLNDNEYLKQLNHLDKIEILCGEPCVLNCPNRIKHYESVSRVALGLEDPRQFTCMSDSETRLCDEILALPNAVTNQRVDDLSDMGIQYFKISGRNLTVPNWLAIITYYLVLPEYRDHVLLELLNAWW